MLAALEEGVKGTKWFSMIDKVYAMRTLELAWAKVTSNAGACGVEGITTGCFAKDSQRRLLAVTEQLKRGTYQPQPVKRVMIPKPGSAQKRPLGIPVVRDRVVQTALRMAIEPIFEKEFAPHSYGFCFAALTPCGAAFGWLSRCRSADPDVVARTRCDKSMPCSKAGTCTSWMRM